MQLSASEAYEIVRDAGTFKSAIAVLKRLAAAERDAGKTSGYGDRNADQSGRADRMPSTNPGETIQRLEADERRRASKTKQKSSGGCQQLKVVLGNGVAAKRCDQDGPAEEA